MKRVECPPDPVLAVYLHEVTVTVEACRPNAETYARYRRSIGASSQHATTGRTRLGGKLGKKKWPGRLEA